MLYALSMGQKLRHLTALTDKRVGARAGRQVERDAKLPAHRRALLPQGRQDAMEQAGRTGIQKYRPRPIGLRDGRATAETLFGLVNLICEKMMMEPKHVEAVYTKLRERARNAMEQREQGTS